MPVLRKLIAGSTAFLVAQSVAMDPAVARDDEAQLWILPNAKIPLSPGMSAIAEGGIRYSESADGLAQIFARGSFQLDVADDLSLALGYGHFQNYKAHRRSGTEERPFQQLNWSMGKAAGGEWSSRTRLEERLFSGSNRVEVRFRERVGFRGKPIGNSSIRPDFSGEILFNLNRTASGQSAGINSVRGKAGLSAPVADHLDISLAYMALYVPRTGEDRMLHVALTGMSYHF
ncbi:DUF2490 domain-containing protein [Parasphingorhabdus sp.]|uniref:DUF2490 domain-containing protein n=1 Tax=Parasphingorhabdus sp. TaxID=2709688 RepID=UPI003A925E1B